MMFFFFLIVAFFLYYSISPFFENAYRNKELAVDPGIYENLSYRKEEILSTLNDLEYDFKMKKMSEADYRQLKSKMTQEAIEVMKSLDNAEGMGNKNANSGTARKPKAHKVRS